MGGFNLKKPKKPKTPFLGFLGFIGFLLDIFKEIKKKRSYKSLLARCSVTLVDFKSYFSPFKICLSG